MDIEYKCSNQFDSSVAVMMHGQAQSMPIVRIEALRLLRLGSCCALCPCAFASTNRSSNYPLWASRQCT